MKRTEARTLINEDIPITVRSQFVPAIRRAYDIVARLPHKLEILDWPVGADILGILRRVAVEYEIKKLIDKQNLPLKYIIAPNAKENCHHLVLYSKRCKITISQLKSIRQKPRDAIFRTNYSLQGRQLQLDFPDEFLGIDGVGELNYMILTHGFSGPIPEFMSLSVPSPYVKEWLDQIDLLTEPHPVHIETDDLMSEEQNLLEFKKEINEVLKDGKATAS